MANKASDHLFQLIDSMTKPEKRYFKIYATRHQSADKKNYIKLFDAIDHQSEYDEEKILKKFETESFIKRFSIAKNRLYNSILKGLGAFHASNSVESILRNQIHHIEILYKKSLYAQSIKLLNSCKQQAQKHQCLFALVELNDWEKRLIEKFNYEQATADSLAEIRKNDEAITGALAQYNDMWFAKSVLFKTVYTKGRARNEEEANYLNDIIENHLPKKTPNDGFIMNPYIYHHIYSAYYFSQLDFKKCKHHLVENLDLVKSNWEQFRDEPNILVAILSNLIYVNMQLNSFSESEVLLEELHAFSEKEELNNDLKLRIRSMAYSIELSLCKTMGDFDKGIELIPEIETFIAQNEENISGVKKASFYFNIAVLHFEKENLNESLKWINQLLNNIGINESEDIHCFAQLLYLIVHLELGNKSLLPFSLRSTKRYLETRNKLYKFEDLFLTFIREIMKDKNSTVELELYNKLHHDLTDLKKEGRTTAFEYFDFIGWAQKKSTALSHDLAS